MVFSPVACTLGGKKKSTFIKNQEASGLLGGLGIRTPLNNTPLIGDIFLTILEMINLKWMRSLKNFSWMETSLYLNDM